MANNQAQQVWRVRLCSALRTTLACIIVGCTALYGPASLKSIITYPAFAYLTTILIVSDATLGDVLRGCCHALNATIQVIPLSMLTLWMVGPAQFTKGLAALAVTVGSFVIALPESTHIMSKRIAFGQLVVVYVGAVVIGAKTDVVMHPLHVASSTCLGALASIVAMLLPYPHLAYCQMKKECTQYAENASERLNLFVEALTAQDNSTAQDLISKSVYFTKRGLRILKSITSSQEGIVWEMPHLRLLKSNGLNPGGELENIETRIKGMEIALSSCKSFPVDVVDEDMKDVLGSMKAQCSLRLEQAKSSVSFKAATAPETKEEIPHKFLKTVRALPAKHEDLPAFFFLYCMRLLQHGSSASQYPESLRENPEKMMASESCDPQNQKLNGLRRLLGSLTAASLDGEKLLFPLKCSISLGFAVLFGLMYNKENGYWSGLTIAISFATGRQATFTLSNARAQGTAMGSVYGVLFSYILQNLGALRLLPLIPWIIFTSFLRHSRMYGQPGAISAVIGALLILGRKNYGTPSEFAITRITEACIGLICVIVVETLLHPARAANLAKVELSRCLGALGDCIDGITLGDKEKDIRALKEKQQNLESYVKKLEEFAAVAETEPNFWFLPFNSACYNKLLDSLSKMTDLLVSAINVLESLSDVSDRLKTVGKDAQQEVYDDLDMFRSKVGDSLRCLEEVTSVKSLAVLERELTNKNISRDIESGSPNVKDFKFLDADEGETAKILNSMLKHLNEVFDAIQENEADETLNGVTILNLGSLGFCIGSLMRETMEIEKEIKNLLQWENPSSHIDLHEISCKLYALYAKQN